jgi:hypothetical protein
MLSEQHKSLEWYVITCMSINSNPLPLNKLIDKEFYCFLLLRVLHALLKYGSSLFVIEPENKICFMFTQYILSLALTLQQLDM